MSLNSNMRAKWRSARKSALRDRVIGIAICIEQSQPADLQK
jgi:hypothetical protein